MRPCRQKKPPIQTINATLAVCKQNYNFFFIKKVFVVSGRLIFIIFSLKSRTVFHQGLIKTYFMTFSLRKIVNNFNLKIHDPSCNNHLTCNCNLFKRVESVRYLGVILDELLSNTAILVFVDPLTQDNNNSGMG